MPNDLIQFAAEQQRQFDAATSPDERKGRGHFGTPASIATYMAAMYSSFPSGKARILDPGAGVGMLSAAICERVLKDARPQGIELELWENDPALIPFLQRVMQRCQESLRDAGCEMDYMIRTEDFILSNSQKSLFSDGPAMRFDLAILNPPYFKVRKESLHARAMDHVVHGQPNIYAFFMAVTADLLLPSGEMVAITPRSYFNGPYFRRFRRWFFDRIVARSLHLFESRTLAFQEDSVLQENVILHAQKGTTPADIFVRTSQGRELDESICETVPYDQVVDNTSGDCIIRVSTDKAERDIIETLDRLPDRLANLGLEISTGPVVSFRATKLLRYERSKDTAPLLWMHNVRPFVTRFPPSTKKPIHIAVNQESKRLLLPAKTYLLFKRFTAKEERRRLVAGVFQSQDSYSEWVGLENHLNYLHRPKSELSLHEALGLAAFFNSTFVDRYFRAISGNTQVNAAEIRRMPIPGRDELVHMGSEVEQLAEFRSTEIDRIVAESLGISDRLAAEFTEV